MGYTIQAEEPRLSCYAHFIAAAAVIVTVQLVVIGIFQLRRLVLSALYDMPVSLQLMPSIAVGGKCFMRAGSRNCKRARVPHEVIQVSLAL